MCRWAAVRCSTRSLPATDSRPEVGSSAIEIGSSDMSCTLSPAQGLDHRAHLLLDRPSGGAALLTLRPVDVRDWALYEVRVRKLSA